MQAFISVLVVMAISGSGGTRAQEDCSARMSYLEQEIASRLITRSSWEAFRRVARLRHNKGLEVIPGMIGCADLLEALNDLRADAATRSSLRRSGLSAKAYLEIGWALLIANDPESFRVNRNAAMASNIAFIARHRLEVDTLLGTR